MFQSTRPIRGATQNAVGMVRRKPFQSTRPIRGATKQDILIGISKKFQSTRPIRGATSVKYHVNFFMIVSIHAPHTRRDIKQPLYFNPVEFQSTRPIRGATSPL